MIKTNKQHKPGDHPRVMVDISGGVATVFQKSKGVEVVIRDYDNEPVTTQIYSLNDEIRAV